jgi:hypothetical protein
MSRSPTGSQAVAGFRPHPHSKAEVMNAGKQRVQTRTAHTHKAEM